MKNYFLPESIATYSDDVDKLTYLITAFVVGWFIVSFCALMYIIFRYARKEGVKAEYATGSTMGELKLILGLLVLVVGSDLFMDEMTVDLWAKIKNEVPTENVVKVKITASQWVWNFTYAGPDGQLGTDDDIKAPEVLAATPASKEALNDPNASPDDLGGAVLVVPYGKNVVFDLVAADVIHSFWVKELRLTQDAVPGRTIQGWFNIKQESVTAENKGRWELACKEVCGDNHSFMRGYIRAVSNEDFEKYLKDLSDAAAKEKKESAKTAAKNSVNGVALR